MTSLTILVPVLNRPQNVAPLVRSIELSTSEERRDGWLVDVVFLCSSDDSRELSAVKKQGSELAIMHAVIGRVLDRGQYARKINAGAIMSESEWLFLGADDLRFHPGWLREAIDVHIVTGALVIGTQDLGNQLVKQGRHATHPLVHSDYLNQGTIDEPNKLLHEGYDHNCCNPSEAPIWMADLSFKSIGTLRAGDRVIGWEYNAVDRPTVGAARRSLCYSEVLAVSRRSAPLVRVVMESGREFKCTPDHRWLNACWMPSSSHDRQWTEPRVGRSLLHVIDEPAPRYGGFEREYGWLAGIYDGEGSGIVIATQSEGNREVVDEIARLLDVLEIPHTQSLDGDVHHFTLVGGRQSYLDYLLQVQPLRSRGLASHIVGYRRRHQSRRERVEIGVRRFGHRDRVVAVEALPGEHEVVSMQTTSGNYIAHGYASRNCDVEFIETAIFRDQFAFADDSVVEHLHPLWHPRTVRRDAVYQKGLRGAVADRQLLNKRRHLWHQPSTARPPSVRAQQEARRRAVMAGRPRRTTRWPKR